MKHTKGPWVVYGDWGIKDADGQLIAQFEDLAGDIDNRVSDEAWAKDNLISAAPDMLEALTNIIECWDGPLYRHKMLPNIEIARKALAKARGEA